MLWAKLKSHNQVAAEIMAFVFFITDMLQNWHCFVKPKWQLHFGIGAR